jgi:hypothetical protein
MYSAATCVNGSWVRGTATGVIDTSSCPVNDCTGSVNPEPRKTLQLVRVERLVVFIKHVHCRVREIHTHKQIVLRIIIQDVIAERMRHLMWSQERV